MSYSVLNIIIHLIMQRRQPTPINLDEIHERSFAERLIGRDDAHIGQTYMAGVRGITLQKIIEILDGVYLPNDLYLRIIDDLNMCANHNEFTYDEKQKLLEIKRTIKLKYNKYTCTIDNITRHVIKADLYLIHTKAYSNQSKHKHITGPRKLGSSNAIGTNSSTNGYMIMLLVILMIIIWFIRRTF